jgi:shikimate dehydrogenase
VDAATRLIGLFGHPVGHSLSPSFMNEALAALGANCVYLAFDVEADSLGEAVNSLRLLRCKGANVTIPHKQAVTEFLDAVDEDARTIGAVNCVVNRNGSLIGRNTDHLGFRDTLAARGFSPRSAAAALIGCGGAARGVLFTLVRGGVGKVFVVNRTEQRALELAAWADRALGFGGVEYIGWQSHASRDGNAGATPGADSAFRKALSEANLVVNTTPVGMRRARESAGEGSVPAQAGVAASPLGGDVKLRRGALVYDLVYNPRVTPLLAWAGARGASTLNGLPMLVLQGLHSLALWFPEREREVFSLERRFLGVCERTLRRSQ